MSRADSTAYNLHKAGYKIDTVHGYVERSQKQFLLGSEDKDEKTKSLNHGLSRDKKIRERLLQAGDTQSGAGVKASAWSLSKILGSRKENAEKDAAVQQLMRSIDKTENLALNTTRTRKQFHHTFSLALYDLFLYSPLEADEQKPGSGLMRFKRAHISEEHDLFPSVSFNSTKEEVQCRAEALLGLSKIVIRLLEKPENAEPLATIENSPKWHPFAEEIASRFETTLETFAHVPEAEDTQLIVDCAARSVTLANEYRQLPDSPITSATPNRKKMLDASLQIWDARRGGFAKALNIARLSKPVDKRPSSIRFTEDALAAEIQFWNESGSISTLTLGEASRRICKETFRYASIPKKIEERLNIPVIFSKPPSPDTITRIGGGAFGTIYSVKLPKTKKLTVTITDKYGVDTVAVWDVRKIVVKVIRHFSGARSSDNPYSAENLTCAFVVRELRIWSEMRHERILPLTGLYKNFRYAGDIPYLPMPVSLCMEEGDLHHYLTTHKNVYEPEKLSFLLDIADALSYMHNHKCQAIHGDLKANNVLVKDGHAYLCDFGLSTMLDGVNGLSSDVHANCRWAAPELLIAVKGHRARPTFETDIFSFGCVFLEVFTGAVPWSSVRSESDLFRLRCQPGASNTIPARPDCSEEYWDFMRKCWRDDPILRPTAKQVFQRLDAFVNSKTPDIPKTSRYRI